MNHIYSMVEMRKAAWIYIIYLLIFISMLSVVSTPSFADILTTVTADIDQDEVAVDVSPGATGSNTATGIVTADNYNTATPLIVTLDAHGSIGSATVTPPSMVFQGNKDSETFQVVVVVPLLSSASEDHMFTLTGTWQQGGRTGDVEGDTCKIIILPFYRPQISSGSIGSNITKGESTTFDLLVNNSGNTDDVIRVEIENKEELEERGIAISEISDMPIAEGGSKEFKLSVKTSKDTPAINGIDVIATSTIDEEPDSDHLHLTVYAGSKGPLEVIYDPTVLIIMAVAIIVGIVVYLKRR